MSSITSTSVVPRAPRPPADWGEQVAATVPGAVHQSLDGQPHNVADEAMAPALIAFFQ